MPAEWEPHQATWLSWPKNKITWPGSKLKNVELVYLQMMQATLPGERVELLVDDQKSARRVYSLLQKKKTKKLSNLRFHFIKTVDTWIRDYGPIFVKPTIPARPAGGHHPYLTGRQAPSTIQVAFTKWIFNAWGGKYSDLARDNGVVNKLEILKKYKRFDPGIILEGGSIDVNGKGTLLTTEQCLLNKNRNKNLSRVEIENYLKKFLGVSKIIWLKEGIEGDDTDGHVDDITRFVNPSTIVTAAEKNTQDKNHFFLKENLEILKRSTDQDRRKFQIVELPMPGKLTPGRLDTRHPCLPASYANFYITNKSVLLPIYSHFNDKEAIRTLKGLFPGRQIAAIECSSLVYGLGSIHCVTQQQPL